MHFQSLFNPVRHDDSIRTIINIASRQYYFDDLIEMEIEETKLPILNNFVQMDIMSEYSKDAGAEEVKQILRNMKDISSRENLRMRARISNCDEITLLKSEFGELLEDDDLLSNSKGKYKRDLLYDYDIIKKENGKYLYNV